MNRFPTFLTEDEVTLRPHHLARRVRLKVLPPGRVEVVVPLRFDRRQLPGILHEHREWLERTLEKVRREQAEGQALLPPRVIKLPALEREWAVDYREGTVSRCRETKSGLSVSLSGDADSWRQPLRQWLMRKARSELLPWLKAVSEETGLTFNGVAVRGQKSRWGSCSAQKNINLNFKLLFVEPDLVRYLFVHELCHTVHMNHSPRYWALVASHQPNHRIYDKALRRAERELPLWLQGL